MFTYTIIILNDDEHTIQRGDQKKPSLRVGGWGAAMDTAATLEHNNCTVTIIDQRPQA